MENKTSYTFDDAIEEVSKTTIFGVNFHQAAELYKEKATEELRKKVTSLEETIKQSYKGSKSTRILYEQKFEELRKENEALKSLLIESEGVRDKTALILKTQTITNCKAEIERLTQSNKDLEENFMAFKQGIAKGSELYANLKFDDAEFTPYQLALQKIEKLEESNKELVEALKDTAENLEIQLGRLGCSLYGDGKDHLANEESFGGFATLEMVRDLIQKSKP